ncbi:MAG: NAD(P)-binding domain-containing protein, partial [Lachnospiraceae bacterium]|nr:NAD(P)-binding domain-containing protein [Lachnospiraceae bacterium]
MKIGFIGMGNMGYAMMKGILKEFRSEDIIFSDANRERCMKVSEETNVTFAESNAECANSAKYLVLAVKPQYYAQVLKNIEHVVKPDHVIISIAPGITVESLKNTLGYDKRIVRAMPNTPALIGCGMTGICYDDKEFDFNEKDIIDKIFSSFGRYK